MKFPAETWFSDETPGGDLIGVWIDPEENDLVIEAEGERESAFTDPNVNEYRLDLSKILAMIDHETDQSLEFLIQQYL